MDKLKDISSDELATIRIALLDKIDDVQKYIKMAQDLQQPISVKYWEASLDKHTTLLNKLY